MNYSQKVLFDDWINKCPIEGVFVDEPVSQVRMDDGEFGYLIKVFLTINKEDWEGSSITIGDCLLDLQTHINELHDYFSQELKE